jgi:hypothetical protein
MNALAEMKERTMEAIWEAPNQRLRPIDLKRKLEEKHSLVPVAIRDVLKELIGEGKLVYTYRDPCSYVEIPATEIHQAAPPMKDIQDKSGE